MSCPDGVTVPKGKYKIEVSSNGTVWTDISGKTNNITGVAQARKVAETHVGGNDNPEITAGKREAVKGSVRVIYSEDALQAWELLRAAHEGGGCIYVRYAPRGGTSGNFLYTSADAAGTTAAPAIITNLIYPEGEAGAAEPVMGGFDFVASSLLKGTVA